LPLILQILGFCLPLTYSVDALRQSLLAYGGLMHRWVDLLILAGFCFIFLALAKTPQHQKPPVIF
jgi:uncharacterized phage infection (PIP) family protein YhgE